MGRDHSLVMDHAIFRRVHEDSTKFELSPWIWTQIAKEGSSEVFVSVDGLFNDRRVCVDVAKRIGLSAPFGLVGPKVDFIASIFSFHVHTFLVGHSCLVQMICCVLSEKKKT